MRNSLHPSNLQSNGGMSSALLAFFVLILMASTATAQVSGYKNKRFIIKIDPLAPIYQKGVLVNLDYVVARKLVFAVAYNRAIRKHTQRISLYKQVTGAFPEDKGIIDEHQFGVELQFYPNKSLPAPVGIYIFANYFQGLATVTGNSFAPNTPPTFLKDYEIDGVRSNTFTFGIGNQGVVWERVTLGFDFGLTVGALGTPSTTPEDAAVSFQSFTDRYGPNIYSFGELLNNGGMGMSGHLRIGMLLF